MATELAESLSVISLDSSGPSRPRIQHNNYNNTYLDETRGDVSRLRNDSYNLKKNKSLLNISIGEAVIGSPSPNESRRARRVVASNSTLDMTHIKDHYMECIRLSTENKINCKNAFLLKLNSLTSTEAWTNEGETDFKMAGMAVDASAKIYAGRVDAMHNDTYSVLGTLGTRQTNEGTEVAGGIEVNDGGDEQSNSEKKGKAKKAKSKSVLEKPENLNYRNLELQPKRDPIWEKLAAASDIGTSSSLLSFHFPISERYFQLQIDSSQPYNFTYESPWHDCKHQEGSECVKKLFQMWDSIDHSPAPTTWPTLEGYEFNEKGKFVKVSSERREESNSDTQTQSPTHSLSPQLFIPEVEDSFQSPDNSESEPDVPVPCPPPSPLTLITRTLEMIDINEYSYLNADTLKELKKKEEKFNRANSKSSAVQHKPAKIKEPKKSQLIDFSSELSANDLEYQKSCKSNQNTDKSVVAKAEQKNFYRNEEQSLPFDSRKLSSLFLIPSAYVKIKKQSAQTGSEEITGDASYYNYDGDADVSAYIPFENQEGDKMDPEISLSDKNISMVAPPLRPEKIVLNFDRRLKQIDMKALKDHMWNFINTQENPGDDTGAMVFSLICDTMLNTNANEHVTKAVLFSTLLHLANEHSLILEQPDFSSDIKICKTQNE
ncbi:Condensin complex subunit 2 [Oopsacas minuta]|uniref:Condensin complex subunit 2 n=1 Tax=Oopsacas minuta TaxID=111878 RepID=A0AAV7JZP1_9METZ|nr:Condensin complex subunit 2 [Oopsacas minuta]